MNAVLRGYQVDVTTMNMGMVDPAQKPQRATQAKTKTIFVERVAAKSAKAAQTMPKVERMKGLPPLFIRGPMIRREIAVPTQNIVNEVATSEGGCPSSNSTYTGIQAAQMIWLPIYKAMTKA